MSRPATSQTFREFWRTALIALSAGSGVASLCLVVFGSGPRQLRLGVLLGLWAALIAAFVIFGARRGQSETDTAAELERARDQAAEAHAAQLKVVALQQEQLEAARQAYFSQEIELRQFGELQLARDASARRESDLNLALSLRREVERVLVDQLGSLREEVAALRAEVVDKLGGQLRLERIETTRVIGSDLEALQHEIRRLAAGGQDRLAAPPRTVEAGHPAWAAEPANRAAEPAGRAVEPVSRAAEPAPRAAEPVARAAEPAAGVAESATRTAGPADRAAEAGSWTQPERRASSDIVDAELVEFPPPPTELPHVSRAAPVAAADPFASLPRLSPLQADLDLLPDQLPDSAPDPRAGRRRAPDPEPSPDAARYQGRRRADGDPAPWLAEIDT